MKEQILQKLIEYLQSTQDFVLQQTPEVIQQALRYHYLSNLIGCIICSFLIIFLIILFYYTYMNPTNDKYDNRDMLSFMICVMSPIFTLISCISLFHYSDNLIKISCAPKYFLLELFMNKAK